MLTKLLIGSLSFNDNDNYFVSSLAGLEMPPVRVANYNLAGEHFGLFIGSFYGKRPFSVRGLIKGNDINDFIAKRDALQNALDILSGEKTLEFTLNNGRVMQIDAIPVRLDFGLQAGVVNAAEFNAGFEASFPFLVSTTEYSEGITLAYGGGGKVPPDTMPMGLAADQGGKIYVVNAGNGIYYPTARINGPVLNPALRNNTLGKDLRFTIELAAGDYLDIDFKRKTVVDKTGLNRYSIKSGDWWHLQPGTNEIRFLADAYDASAFVNFYWRDSWLGI